MPERSGILPERSGKMVERGGEPALKIEDLHVY
jgi:hypothetical protein